MKVLRFGLGLPVFLTGFLCLTAPAQAIVWCHDYAFWEASGRRVDLNNITVANLRSRLGRIGYRRVRTFRPGTTGIDSYIQSGDVVILGNAHSGFVNSGRRVDHLLQPPGAPGTRFAGIRARTSANFKSNWSLRYLWTHEYERRDRFGQLHRRAPYRNMSVEIWRRAQVRKLFQGRLTKGDPLDPIRRKRHRKVYTVALQAGRTYTIDLESGDGRRGPHNPGYFDTWLRLEDASGRTIRNNDDGGAGYNSKIVFTPNQSGGYRLVVTSYSSGATGSFVLSVRD